MIRSLCDYYDALVARGEDIPLKGYSSASVTFALVLSENGSIQDVVSLMTSSSGSTSKKQVSRKVIVPLQNKKTSGIMANFLCDAPDYFLGLANPAKYTGPKGVDTKRKQVEQVRARKCFKASKDLHIQLLNGLEGKCAKAISAFFSSWNPDDLEESIISQNQVNELFASQGSLVFRVDGCFAHEDAEIMNSWDEAMKETGEDSAVTGICPVLGKRLITARIHASIKGVPNSQSAGAAIVSFNFPASNSYGRLQNYNSSISEDAAFKYTTALNRLLARKETHKQFGDDLTIAYWSMDSTSKYQDCFASFIEGEDQRFGERGLNGIIESLQKGYPIRFDDVNLDSAEPFAIVGISPNAARLSIRFFMKDEFGIILRNISNHYHRLEIVRPAYDHMETVPIWQLLAETVNKKAKSKAVQPLLAGAVFNSVLMNTNYPEILRQSIMIRIRADGQINRIRCAIIKAYLIKEYEYRNSDIKEVLTVVLNEESTYLPYVLGRIFSILEQIQNEASGGNLAATIKDRYFNSASATPSVVFPILLKLKNSHIKTLMKKNSGRAINFERMLTELFGRIQETLPQHLSLDEQGAYILGYYHQTQKRFEKKETTGENK